MYLPRDIPINYYHQPLTRLRLLRLASPASDNPPSSKMLALALTADLEGYGILTFFLVYNLPLTRQRVTDLHPVDTQDSPFYYLFKVQCTSCRETHPNWISISRFVGVLLEFGSSIMPQSNSCPVSCLFFTSIKKIRCFPGVARDWYSSCYADDMTCAPNPSSLTGLLGV